MWTETHLKYSKVLSAKGYMTLRTFFLDPVVELGSLTTANLMEKVKGLQNLAYQLGLEECKYMARTLQFTLVVSTFKKANSN